MVYVQTDQKYWKQIHQNIQKILKVKVDSNILLSIIQNHTEMHCNLLCQQ